MLTATPPKRQAKNRVRARREKLGMTQLSVAIASGVHPSALSRIEAGVNVEWETAEKLARALKCKVADLFPGLEKPE